ncbi:MAG: DEAD/DEAH box helicase, partial [Acidobacteriia bacterium]|nr:DEAD/DEAH box helicase [Terriglobia bacterium]
ELADALATFVALPEGFVTPDGATVGDRWGAFFDVLVSQRRTGRASCAGRLWWVPADKARMFLSIFPEAQFQNAVAEVDSAASSRDDAVTEMVRGFMSHVGPVVADSLAGALGLAFEDVQGALLRLEASGAVLRGLFTGHEATEWCERRLLARIHRMTLGALRAEIAPIPPSQLMSWLLHWQHLAPGTQVHGERGLLEVLRQLQGFEIPANAWEPQILARRVADFDPKILDQLCLTGAVGWGRISPHPATLDQTANGAEHPAVSRRVVPSSVAPITFFIREDADWLALRHVDSFPSTAGLSPAGRQVLEFLEQRGASFFVDIVRGTGRLKSEVETALWELVAAGRVTADGFDNLRALIDPKRRAGQGRGKTSRPRHSTGRWSLLFSEKSDDRPRAVEALCKILLERYGVVFRELLTRENLGVKWRELLVSFRRLEDRGDVRGGRFVDGFLGEQFALPVAVESLRAMRKAGPRGETVTLAAADPLNMAGVIIPGDRVPAISGRRLALRDGVLVGEGDISSNSRAECVRAAQ